MAGIDSTRLKEKREKILCLWEERCLKEVVSAGTATYVALRDSLPLYLDHLSEALATNKRMDFRSVFRRDEEGSSIGKMHGADRANNKNYELTEVIFEYHILREVIFQILENEGPLEQVQRDIVLNSIEQAVNDAAVEFSEIHTGIQQKFIHTLTHDLKTPIAAAKMNAQWILKRSDVPDPSRHSVKKIIVSMNRLEAMIHDLLDAGRIRSGEGLSLQFVPCDLEQVIRESVEEMSEVHGSRFLFDSSEAMQGIWGCDGIRRALENLLDNAVKYSTPKTPIIVSLIRKELVAEVRVHNEGEPIHASEIPILFQPFHRSKSALEGSKTGWGLGLTLVKGVMDAHKGNVRVESKKGEGTSFILEIPFDAHSSDNDSSRSKEVHLNLPAS